MARNITFQQAINEALAHELDRDPTVVVFGEDVVGGAGTAGEDDAWGGVLGVTKGLYHRFPGRVLDTPISESAFVGAAIGAATAGLRPVDLARFGLGLWALARPAAVLRLGGSDTGTGPRMATRVLGARYVVQSAGGLLLRRRPLPEVDAAVDLVHALSMVGAARAFPQHRRLALTSGVIALGFALADLTEPVR